MRIGGKTAEGLHLIVAGQPALLQLNQDVMGDGKGGRAGSEQCLLPGVGGGIQAVGPAPLLRGQLLHTPGYTMLRFPLGGLDVGDISLRLLKHTKLFSPQSSLGHDCRVIKSLRGAL